MREPSKQKNLAYQAFFNLKVSRFEGGTKLFYENF